MNYILRYDGRNFVSLLGYLSRLNLCVFKINERKDFVTFRMTARDYNIFKTNNKIFKLTVIRKGGFSGLSSFLFKKIGVIVGVVLICFWSILSSKITLTIKVVGNNVIDESVIKNAIESYGYRVARDTSFNKEKMEEYILNNVNGISMVSVAKQGNVLMVNVVEKNDSNISAMPFYAPYNMVIKEINLISGTLAVNKNDIVKKGDVLVYDYVINSSGEKINVSANANISADVYFSSNIVVNKISKKLVKTGKKITKNYISFLKPKQIDIDNNYILSDTNYVTYNISTSMFLPIYHNKIEICELCEEEEIFDYENNKDKFLKETIKNAYTFVPNGVIINNEISKVDENENSYFFQTYLISEMRLTNEN